MQKALRVLVTGQAEDEEQKRKAAEWALQIASPELIVEMVKKMQEMKGRFYTEIAERLYGRDLDEEQLTRVERSICEMMQAKRMTLAVLAEWYKLALETVFDGDRFTPLPDYTDCIQLVYQARDATQLLRQKAGDILAHAPLAEETRQVETRVTTKTLPELFKELKLKLE